MKIYIDSTREPPEGWRLIKWPDNVYEALGSGKVTEISLDYHLVDNDYAGGLTILENIEKAVIEEQFVPPRIFIHTTDEKGRKAMEAVAERIQLHHLNNSL